MRNRYKLNRIKLIRTTEDKEFLLEVEAEDIVYTYMTVPILNEDEYQSFLNMTEHDWRIFLKNTSDYYLIDKKYKSK